MNLEKKEYFVKFELQKKKYIYIVQFLPLYWLKVNYMILLREKITMAVLFMEL